MFTILWQKGMVLQELSHVSSKHFYGLHGTADDFIVFLRQNKVITTMVIRPLDDPTWRAKSVVADFAAI